MSQVKLYLDEDVNENLATQLRREGFDIITTTEAGNKGKDDRVTAEDLKSILVYLQQWLP